MIGVHDPVEAFQTPVTLPEEQPNDLIAVRKSQIAKQDRMKTVKPMIEPVGEREDMEHQSAWLAENVAPFEHRCLIEDVLPGAVVGDEIVWRGIDCRVSQVRIE